MNATEDRSTAELVRALSEQSSRLAQMEVELAKAELTEKGKKIGAGAGAFGAAGVVALYMVGALVATAILALSEAVDAWLAALIVAVALGAVAGVLALTGKKSVEAGSPPVPERAIDTTKRDIDTAKERAREGRS
ncbi:MAG TPA: phage holin family protein [Solirubrobacterales bacterium]|nr:phage holin family protein [Solirubrobacterales bacterium]